MTKAKQSGAFKGHRFPPEIISYAVWAYFRFPMSFRDVEDLLYKRGVIVSYETIRSWVGKFGHQYANVIRCDRPAPSGKWHLDEVVITIRGKKYWLWRAVDSKGPSHRCKQRLPGNGRAGYSCTVTPQYKGSRPFLSQIVQAIRSTARPCYRQTGKLWGGPQETGAWYRPSCPQGIE
jgi:hypothetical protein